MMNRRDFVQLASLAATAASFKAVADAPDACAPMHGFAAPPLETVRVAMIGVGARGSSVLGLLCNIPGLVVTAVCDLHEDRAKRAQKIVSSRGFPEPKAFVGPEAYKQLIDSGICDVVHINTSWVSHFMIAHYALNAGRHAFLEVPGVRTIEHCWALVEASEKNRVHCSVLANCCYGDEEMMMINAVHQQVFGEIMHAEGCYLHETRCLGGQSFLSRDKMFSSLEAMIDHTGMQYPVHQFGPVALALDVNRGDRAERLVSMGSAGFAWQRTGQKMYGADSPVGQVKFESNDFNTTLVQTAKGKTILLRQCNNSPMPYTREYRVYGFDGGGSFQGSNSHSPTQIGIEQRFGRGVGNWMDGANLNAFRAKYRSPLWANYSGLKGVGGHGGMDFFLNFRWSYCLRKGLPLDIDVYDLATWSAVFELSERSVRNKCAPQEFPDFTHGKWKTTPPIGDMSVPKGYV